MDIYGLKADATGAYYDAQYLERETSDPELKKRYSQQKKTAEILMYACENATSVSTQNLTQELKDNLWDLSQAEAKRVRALIRELGYTLR